MGWSAALILQYDKKNHCALFQWRRQICFFFLKKLYVVLLVRDAVQIHFRFTPAVRVAVEGRGCAPVNAEGF